VIRTQNGPPNATESEVVTKTICFFQWKSLILAVVILLCCLGLLRNEKSLELVTATSLRPKTDKNNGFVNSVDATRDSEYKANLTVAREQLEIASTEKETLSKEIIGLKEQLEGIRAASQNDSQKDPATASAFDPKNQKCLFDPFFRRDNVENKLRRYPPVGETRPVHPSI